MAYSDMQCSNEGKGKCPWALFMKGIATMGFARRNAEKKESFRGEYLSNGVIQGVGAQVARSLVHGACGLLCCLLGVS